MGAGQMGKKLGSKVLRFPKFLVLGVQKGGTTTLHHLLAQHPQVWLSPRKELHYFTLNYWRGACWYANQFRDARDEPFCGDITPYYIFHPEAPARIKHLLPDARMIVLLRDPVQRTISQVFHAQRLGLEPLSIEKALEAEAERLRDADVVIANPKGLHTSHQEHSYIARSRYEHQLDNYLKIFKPDQILVVRSEDLFDNPEVIWVNLLKHIGLDYTPLPSVSPANVGTTKVNTISRELKLRLRQQLMPTYIAVEKQYGIVWNEEE